MNKVTIEKIIGGYLFIYEDGKKAFEKNDNAILSRIHSLTIK